jgi:hypothetical protein
MPSYVVKITANTPGLTLKNGHDIMIVEAEDAADAVAVAAGHYDGDGNTAWTGAVATEIDVAADLSPVTNAAGTITAYALRVTIVGDDLNQTFEHVATAGQSYADVFNAMVALLNADAVIAGAGFAANLLTVSDIADDLGDHTLTAEFTYGGVAVPSFLGAITHEGIPGAVLSVASNAAPVLPLVAETAGS